MMNLNPTPRYNRQQGARIFVGLVTLGALTTFFSACSFSFTRFEFHRAKEELNSKHYAQAVANFKKIMNRAPESSLALESAREAARITFFDTKSYNQAIEFYNHLVEFSRNEKERRDSQRAIAGIYFNDLSNYPKAIEAYNKLLLVETNPAHIVRYRFNLARSYFYMNRFFDAKNEIEQALRLAKNAGRKFELNMFLASIYFNMKHVDRALNVYKELESKFPKKAKEENIALNESVCYEEAGQFDNAIQELKSIKSTYKDPEFIALKIKQLQERKANLPGAKGLKR